MSDLTLESNQAFTSSITTTCDAVDSVIKSTYTVGALAAKARKDKKALILWLFNLKKTWYDQ